MPVTTNNGTGRRKTSTARVILKPGTGKVTVNDQVAHVGQRISFGDQVRVAGRLVKLRITPPLPRVLAYHKPVGELVTRRDPEGRLEGAGIEAPQFGNDGGQAGLAEVGDDGLPIAGRGLGVDPGLLGGQRHHRSDALQAVSRPHFADQNLLAHASAPSTAA